MAPATAKSKAVQSTSAPKRMARSGPSRMAPAPPQTTGLRRWLARSLARRVVSVIALVPA
jgi:hypothetical protein